MRLRIIIVEPRYQINLGYIARVSKNFGVDRLFLVRPRTRIGERAIMFSKHASELLRGAKACASIGEAARGCSVIIGTTGVVSKAQMSFSRTYPMAEAAKVAARMAKGGTAAVLIGRDDTGLTKDELEMCDIVAHVTTNPEYPVLNISHALGIVLYAMAGEGLKASGGSIGKGMPAGVKETEYLFRVFDLMIKGKKIRNRKAVRSVFRRMVRVSRPNGREVHALITALK